MRQFFASVGLILLAACSGPTGPPFSPHDSLDTFKIEPGFKIELFASEPDIVDPVAMEIDARGNVYVVENSGYPLNSEGEVGRVKLLADTDGDGRLDRTTVFAEKLVMPTGVMAWKRGILVTDPPNVLYFEDRDGDGSAEIRRVVLTGFAFTNPQHTVSSPYFGLDNWIYLSHEGYTRAVVFAEKFGDTGSRITFPDRQGAPTVESARRSLRFKPDSYELELLAGPSQFGQTFDAWGHLFNHNNSNPIRHEVIAAHYLERNADLRASEVAQNLYQSPEAFKVFPITRNPRFELLSGVGQFTSASGLTWYLGGAYDGLMENSTFVAEPTHNLVNRDVIEPQGSTFQARARKTKEHFLASTDSWFRPVNFYVGPDGALYVLDYYREVIEHPEWTSAETYESEAIYHGSDRGRIYRILPAEGKLAAARNVNLADADSATLAGYLEHANIWWRRTAQRLLIEGNREDAVPFVEKLARESKSDVGRVHALWTLEGLGAINPSLLEAALGSSSAGVREAAIHLIERFLPLNPELEERLLALENDPDPKVRLQLLLTLGNSGSKAAQAVRERLLFAEMDDPWFQIAALTWPTGGVGPLLTKAVSDERWTNGEPARTKFFEQAARTIAANASARELGRLFDAIRKAEPESLWVAASLRGLADGLRSRGGGRRFDPQQQRQIISLAESENASLRQAAIELLASERASVKIGAQAVERAARLARDESADPDRRADALRLLAIDGAKAQIPLLLSLIESTQPDVVQAAAVRVYGEVDGMQPVEFFLAKWRELPPKARVAAGEAMSSSDERQHSLVEAIEKGVIKPWMIAVAQKNRLMMHSDTALRQRARALLTAGEQDRQEVLNRYQAALAEPGDAARGRVIFERVCVKCHSLNGEGAEVGPDLATVSTKPASLLLRDILLPNEAIAQTYESYVVETSDGRIVDGVIGPQGPNFVTLRREGGEEDVIERQQISRMYASELSGMPNDLEQQVSVDEMADLLRFIQAGGNPIASQ